MIRSILAGIAPALCKLAGAAQAQSSAPDPEAPGSYPVGVTSMLLMDRARTDLATGEARQLMTEIWYPAADETRGLPPNRLFDFFPRNKQAQITLMLKVAFKADATAADANFHDFAVRDARPRDGVFPLLLFSHGHGGLRMQNAFWCEHLASHGYIVMAPDHTGNCALTYINGKIIPMRDDDASDKQAEVDRPKDLSFLIDEMEKMNLGSDSRFCGRVDLDRIGAAGHSFGGFTCAWLINQDPRIKAIVPMAGAAKERTNFECPVMTLIATEDKTLDKEQMENLRQYYAQSKGPHYSVEFKNAGHFSFTEMYQIKSDFGDGVGQGVRITNGEPVIYISMDKAFRLIDGYTTAFFGKYLKGLDGYDAYLASNRDPEELIVQATP